MLDGLASEGVSGFPHDPGLHSAPVNYRELDVLTDLETSENSGKFRIRTTFRLSERHAPEGNDPGAILGTHPRHLAPSDRYLRLLQFFLSVAATSGGKLCLVEEPDSQPSPRWA
jgi:hypothetical protein